MTELNDRYNPTREVRTRFAMTPCWLLERKEVSPRAKLVWGYLNHRLGDKDYCWPFVDAIALGTGISEREVPRCLEELERLGLLDIVRPGDSDYEEEKRICDNLNTSGNIYYFVKCQWAIDSEEAVRHLSSGIPRARRASNVKRAPVPSTSAEEVPIGHPPTAQQSPPYCPTVTSGVPVGHPPSLFKISIEESQLKDSRTETQNSPSLPSVDVGVPKSEPFEPKEEPTALEPNKGRQFRRTAESVPAVQLDLLGDGVPARTTAGAAVPPEALQALIAGAQKNARQHRDQQMRDKRRSEQAVANSKSDGLGAGSDRSNKLALRKLWQDRFKANFSDIPFGEWAAKEHVLLGKLISTYGVRDSSALITYALNHWEHLNRKYYKGQRPVPTLGMVWVNRELIMVEVVRDQPEVRAVQEKSIEGVKMLWATGLRKLNPDITDVMWDEGSLAQITKLVATYEAPAVEALVEYVTTFWPQISDRYFKGKGGFPSISLLSSKIHTSFIADATVWKKHADVIKEWESYGDKYADRPGDIGKRYIVAMKELEALGFKRTK
jgi:hypothetical protein